MENNKFTTKRQAIKELLIDFYILEKTKNKTKQKTKTKQKQKQNKTKQKTKKNPDKYNLSWRQSRTLKRIISINRKIKTITNEDIIFKNSRVKRI